MKSMITYTSTLPPDLSETLDQYAQRLKLPKNKLIEQALRSYFEKVKRTEYIKSFECANQDEEMLKLADEGFDDYLKLVDDL